VEVYPKTQRLVAQVRLDDAEEDEETIDAVVHHSLYQFIPEGVDLDIAVEMDHDGETFYVVGLMSTEPLSSGEMPYLDRRPSPRISMRPESVHRTARPPQMHRPESAWSPAPASC
jgi:hypothetical protein